MEFKVNLAKGTNWEIMIFTEAIAYGAELNGTAEWSTKKESMAIRGPLTEDGQTFFIYVALPGYEPQNLPVGLLARYQAREGGNFGVIAVNDLQKDLPQ